MANVEQASYPELTGRHIEERQNLLNILHGFHSYDEIEAQSIKHCIALISSTDQCFEREYFNPGHLTASAIIVNRSKTKVLLTHHRKLDMWLQLGGHADGHPVLMDVALMEAHEESGLDNIKPLTDEVLRIDRHIFPAQPHKDVPEHYHHDFMYLLQADTEDDYNVSHESNALRWVTFDEAKDMVNDKAIKQTIKKLQERWDWVQSLAI